VYPKMSVSLDFTFLIASSVFLNEYLITEYVSRAVVRLVIRSDSQ
jgi:hypothetical protein